MRSLMKLFVAAALIVLAAISIVFINKYQQTSSSLASLRASDDNARGEYAQALSSIATIQDSLNSIVLGDEAVRLNSTSYEMEHRMGRSVGDDILDRIAVLRAGVERSKERIADLDEHLRKSGVKIEGLEKMMAALKRSVVRKEQAIARLVMQVDSLHTQVNGLNVAVADKQHELGTVFCLIGDKKDLTQAGAVVATGGILGIGKTLKATGKLDESLCTTIDTDQMDTVEIPSKKAQVLSEQAPSSYTLEPDGDHVVLRILDPKEFRKVRQLVIMKRSA